MLDEKIFPACILVEFHHYQTKEPQRTKSSVNALRKAGYEIFWISDLGAEYGFTRTSSDLPAASGCQAHYK
jgi:glucan phosphoethanolaminetransferase (alkaline phosphatase superfamily)